jgi:heme-degrading monooxygenase HmoA
MASRAQELVIVDIWKVPAGRQQEMTDALRAALEQLRVVDGYIEGDVLANGNDTKVGSYVRFRSAEDWQRATELEEFREQMRALEAIGSSHADTYERISVIAPPTDRGPREVTYGAF